jgi:hypothetical protein
MPSGEHMTRRMKDNDPTEEEIWGVPGGDPGLAFKVRMERPKVSDGAAEGVGWSGRRCRMRTW